MNSIRRKSRMEQIKKALENIRPKEIFDLPSVKVNHIVEESPTLMNLPKGTEVLSHYDTMRMLRNEFPAITVGQEMTHKRFN